MWIINLWGICSFLFLYSCTALYFTVQEEPKCFTLEQPRDTPIVFSYEIYNTDHELSFDLYYGLLSREIDQQIMHKSFKGPAGHIDYVTDNDGYYSYCIKQMKATDGKVSRIRIRINFGFDSEHYESLIKDHNFDAVNLQVHKLNDMLTMTLNEADYQKHKEVEYHSHTEKMNNAALWWPVFQIGILIIAGIFQVQQLKRFFKATKLI